MASSITNLIGPAETALAGLLHRTTNEAIKTKLKLMHAVCHGIVTKGKRLTIAGVVRNYERTRGEGPELGESTIRNKRERGNPYMELYQAWEFVAHEVELQFENGRKRPSNGEILSVRETYAIEDISLRHRTAQVIVRAQSLQKELDLLRAQFGKQALVTIAPMAGKPSVSTEANQGLDLTHAEAEAIKSFLQKLDGSVLKKTPDDGVRISNGPYIADSGFVSALQKALKAADPIPF